MKYKWVTLFILILISSSVSLAEIVISPLDKNVVKTGDVEWIKVEMDGEGQLDVESIVGKYLCNKLYVISVKKTLTEILARVAVTTSTEKNTVNCRLNGLSIEDIDQKLNEKIQSIDYVHEYKIDSNVRWYIFIIIGIVFIGLIFLIYYLLWKLKRKKEFMKRQSELKAILTSAKSRSEIENVLTLKQELFFHFLLQDSVWGQFKERMDSIQFKREWDNSEYLKAENAIEDLRTNIRDKKWSFRT